MSRPEETSVHPDHDDIGCLAAIEIFYAYLDGELTDPREIEDFEKHLEHCRSCFTRAEMERLLTARLKKEAGKRAPERLHNRLARLMEQF
jgi:anti-sigma factor (TIGR02949 family)